MYFKKKEISVLYVYVIFNWFKEIRKYKFLKDFYVKVILS